MKKLLCLFILIGQSARGETLDEVKARVDTWLTNKWDTIVSRQESYKVSHDGQYWQGLTTHVSIPDQTTPYALASDNLTSHPIDQDDTWLYILPEWEGEVLPAAAIVSTYSGPSGDGWIISLWFKFSDVIYMRKKAAGNEISRTTDWQEWRPELWVP